MILRLGHRSVKYILFIIIAFLSVINSAFALQQLTNPDFTNGTTGWTLTTRINGTSGYPTTIDTQNNNLRIYYTSNSNTNRYYDGMARQGFTTPASAINVRFAWGNWSVSGGNRNYNYWLGYTTVEEGISNTTYLDRRTANGNYNGSSLTVTNFTPSTTYYAKLYAYARMGRGTFSALFDSLSVNFSPSGLAGEAVSNGISLTWNTSTSSATTLSKYYIYRSTSSGSGYTKIAEINAGTTSYIDTTVAENNTYYYVITDLDTSSVESPYSKEISLFYLTPPTGLTAQYSYDMANTQDKVNLSWNAKSANGLQSYSIYRSTSENGTYSLIGSTDASTTTYSDTEVSSGVTYYYKISCTTSIETSALSQAVSCYVSKPPTNLTGAINGANNAVLTWEAPSPVNTGHSRYVILRSNSNTGPFTQIGTVAGNILTYTDTSLTFSNGDSYFYAVADLDSSSNYISSFSNVAAVNKLSPPVNLSATNNNGVITLTWTASDCPLAKLGGYNIYRNNATGGPYTKIGSVTGNTLTFDDTTATEGTRWYYVVTTYNINNSESGYSNEANCLIPISVSLTVTIDSSVSPEIVLTETDVAAIPVNWVVSFIQPGMTITGYTISIYKSDGTLIQSGSTSDVNATSYTVNNVLLRNGQSYYAIVKVFYSNGNSIKNTEFISNNSFSAVTPTTMEITDGWSGKDIAYSFFNNRVEACWSHDPNAAVVKYEIAVGTIPYGTDLVDWQEIGLTNRIALTTPELASGTRYFTSVRGITQKKNIALTGCSDGFIARKDPVTKDTDALNFFNNARVLENLSTNNGKITPTGEIVNGNWKYYIPITITEPGVTDRVNAPCLVNFTIPAAQRPANISEFRVVDDQGNVVPRYNLTIPNNSTVDHPYIVFLVNMGQGETRTYYVYWGNNGASEPDYDFVNNTNQNSMNAWTPFYSRKDMPAGLDSGTAKANKITPSDDDDGTTNYNLTSHLSKFKYFGSSLTTWYFCANGLCYDTNITDYKKNATNRFDEFVGNANQNTSDTYKNSSNNNVSITRSNIGKCICPLWCDLQMDSGVWSEAGLFRDNLTNPKRVAFSWTAYRWQVTDDAYIFQIVFYETGDIAIRYNLLNPRALIAPLTHYDLPINTQQNTAGISKGDGNYYLYHTPLQVGVNQNPTAFYQCMNAFEDTTVYGSIVGNGTEYSVAKIESMVFDTRIASPKWTCLKYDATVIGSRKIELAYRTGNTPLPDNSWTAWSNTTSVTSSVINGEIPVTTSGRYIQYKADFKKSGNNGTMTLNEIRFIYGGISIQDVCSVVDGEPVTEVTQGQTGIPLTVTIKNECSEAVSLAVATLTFTLNGHSAVLTDPSLPFNIAAGQLATLTYSIDIADNATTGECTIDALATVSALIYDDSAQNPLTWTVKSKAGLVIDQVYSEYTKVTKGYSYNLFVTLTNTGETDCMLNSIWPTYASGTYTFTFDPSYGLATGTYPGGGDNTIIHGNETKTAKFLVAISSESTSGSDTLGAVASATNMLSGETIEILTTDNPHIWTIQTPAELNLYDIVASTTLYRGQKNNNIILYATNEGEAELEWYTGSSTQYINFTPVTGPAKSYENKKMITEEPVINITSDNIVRALYSIDIKQDTATGTDRITAKLFGKELNTGVSLDYSETLPYLEWTIYSERVNIFADGAYSEEKDSFNKPSVGSPPITIYAKVDNLAYNVEYIVHWIAPDGTEVEKTNPIITSGQGYFGCWLDLDSTCQSGIYKIQVTDPLSLFVSCENTFEVVAPAEMDASFTLPLYATINQPITASFTFINLGGAVIANATLVSTESVRITGTVGNANITFTPDDTEALFSPRLSEVPGYGQATATFKLTATHVGNFTLIASATGFDNNSGLTLSKPNVQSNICTVQNPPDVRITTITKTSDTIFKNQKNLRVTATLVNNGEATAVITNASITFSIGTYEQELMGYPDGLELELASGESKTITFDVGVDVDSASGLDTLTVNAIWYDKNWPRNMSSSANTTWTIAECGIILSANPDFDYEQADYTRGQTIYVRAYGVAPNDNYYRIRFYSRQIAQSANVPNNYMNTDQGYSGLLASNDDGYVEHIYTLPNSATIGTWSVTLEYCGTSVSTQYTTLGSMSALQYFRVQDVPHMTAVIHAENVSIENNDKIFVGDTFRVTMTLTSTTADNNTTLAVNTGAIDFIEPYSLVKNNGAIGNVELVSGPDPATFTLRAGESKTFEYVYRATEFTGNGKFSFKSSNTYAAKGRNRNLWDHKDETPYDVFAHQQTTSNQIDIYIKSMAVDPDTLNFGELNMYSEDYLFGLVCGASQELDMNLVKTGNYDVENIRLNSALLNGPIVDGLRKSISSTYFGVDVASFSNPLTSNSEKTKVSLTIPYNQPSGEYTSTMFLYSDANNNGVFETGEVTADFNVNVYVNDCKVIKINDKVVDAGGWLKGTTTDNFEVNYFNAGNVDLSKVKIIGVGSLTPYINFSTPTNVGAISVGENKRVVFNIEIPNDNSFSLGNYIATYTIFEDNDDSGTWNSSLSPRNPEPYDTFQVHIAVGELNFSVTPSELTSSPCETSYTYRSGVAPTGFAHLTIKNNSTDGMTLSRIKMIADTFDGVDKAGDHYPMASNTVDVYPGTMKMPLESGESDLFDIEVYIAPGTRCATYTTTLRFYSDDNNNNIIDPDETEVDVLFKVYVKPTLKVRVIDKPVSVTGMSSDVQDTYAECEFLCYNLGNVDLNHLKFEMQNLVQKDVPNPVTIDKTSATFSFVGDTPFVAPLNSEFSSKVTIIVPRNTPDGVYVTTVPCKIYNDNGGDIENEVENNGYDEGECFDEFQIWLQIGEMKLVIINPHNVRGDPSERSSDGIFTVMNDGALTVTSVTATATDFIYDGNVIPATASVFLASPKVGTLKPGFQKNVNWVVDIPDFTPAGTYTGKISVWSDTDGNGEIGVTEASATANVTITVNPVAKLSIRENSINPVDIDEWFTPFIMNNTTIKSSVRLYNTGNEPISNQIHVNKNDLTFMTNVISQDDYSFEIEPTLPILPGQYVIATVTVSVGDTHLVNGHYRGELTFYAGDALSPQCLDHVILDVEFGKKELLLSPNPLIFDDLNNIKEQTVTATRVPPASLKKICVYEKNHCECDQEYCDQTTIEVLTPGPINIDTSKDFVFKVNVGQNTPAGLHVATWTFFDDSNGDCLYNEGEYYVDLQIQYIVPDNISVSITPMADYSVVDIAPGETKELYYEVKNEGNIPLVYSNSNWDLPFGVINIEGGSGAIYDLSNFSVYLPAVEGTLAVNATTTFVIRLTAPDDQELGAYPAVPPIKQSFVYNGIGLSSTYINEIDVVRRGPISPNGTVYQLIATDTFEPDFGNPEQAYFLSAWVCPGNRDEHNESYANLSVIRCDEAGKPKAALSVRIGNNDLTLKRNNDPIASFSVFMNTNDGEFHDIGPTSDLQFWPSNDNPYFGISGDPVIATDNSDPTNRLTFYRVYFAFKINEKIATDTYDNPILPEHQDKIAVFLTQSTPIDPLTGNDTNTETTAVYFDGVKLEKSLWPDQDRPTTFHKDTTLVSPSKNLDVSGKHKHYEW